MFNLAIDSKLRGCDIVVLKVEDIAPNGYSVDRTTVRQQKTGQPVWFELTEPTRQAVDDYLKQGLKKPGEFLFNARRGAPRNMTTRQYARLVSSWIDGIGLDSHCFGTHSLRRTKATLIYRRTGNLRAVQLLLGHTKIESTVRYLGIEVDDPGHRGTSGRLIHPGRADVLCSALQSLPGPSKLTTPAVFPDFWPPKHVGSNGGTPRENRRTTVKSMVKVGHSLRQSAASAAGHFLTPALITTWRLALNS
jgi:hypothetical protein